MIALSIFFGCILVLAYSEAVGDAASIEGNIPIDHVRGFALRSILALFSALWAAYVQPMGVWQFVFMLIGGAFLFSAAFRLLLNKMRGLDWRYVSPSSWYDWVFIWTMCPAPTEGGKIFHLFNSDTKAGATMMHDQFIKERPDWAAVIHRAGSIAYITEGIILAACVAAYLS